MDRIPCRHLYLSRSIPRQCFIHGVPDQECDRMIAYIPFSSSRGIAVTLVFLIGWLCHLLFKYIYIYICCYTELITCYMKLAYDSHSIELHLLAAPQIVDSAVFIQADFSFSPVYFWLGQGEVSKKSWGEGSPLTLFVCFWEWFQGMMHL